MSWEVVIGLEVHVQLATASKAFSPSAVAFGRPPNSLTDPTVLGLPGALPVFNEAAMRAAVRLGLACGCTVRATSRFARKHYFYPDLPKGYQISQFDEPICEGGAVEFLCDGEERRVRLTRIHLEEDAGKSTHQPGGASLVDLNRAGVPLCEVVSEPDIRSAREAGEYMRGLRQLVRYLGVGEGDMEKGQLRCDANVSIRPSGQVELGTRTELKNINSFRFVEQALEHEIQRQIDICERGEQVVQETRLWDSEAGVSRSMRGKEEALDYRYFPDPDLPPMQVSQAVREAIQSELPELPIPARRRLIGELELSAEDALALTSEPGLLRYFDAAMGAAKDAASAKAIANWIHAELLREIDRTQLSPESAPVSAPNLAALVALIEDGTISGKIGKKVFSEMIATGDEPAAIVEREGLVQISDPGLIEAEARKVIEANPAQAEQYRAGKESLLGFFVGQVMKATRGKANPKATSEILRKLLGEGP